MYITPGQWWNGKIQESKIFITMFNNFRYNYHNVNKARSVMRAFARAKEYFNAASEDDVVMFITAAIKMGWNTERDIVGKLAEMLGRDKSKQYRTAEILEALTGDDPELHRWFRDKSGRHHLLH